jgi:uncharacterized membrane protein YsdA (DUF1294 family)
MKIAVVAYLSLVAVTSCASFIAYWLDKRRAIGGGRRVPERTLHMLAFLGGWPGALLAQRQFRHKTKKVPFRIMYRVIVVCHVAIVGIVAYYDEWCEACAALFVADPDSCPECGRQEQSQQAQAGDSPGFEGGKGAFRQITGSPPAHGKFSDGRRVNPSPGRKQGHARRSW